MVVNPSFLMLINHLHFYVENATKTRDWFIQKMGFKSVDKIINEHTHTEIINFNNSIFLLISSAVNSTSPVYSYLNNFTSGVADVAFQVNNIDFIVKKLSTFKNHILNYPDTYFFPEGKLKIAKIKGFNSLEHTLIENNTNIPFCYLLPQLKTNFDSNLNNRDDYKYNQSRSSNENNSIQSFDHVVLNVARGKITEAVEFYCQLFGFKIWQQFNIKTDTSGLYSQALIAPNNNFYFNINEPTSDNSQIQEFIDFNGGSGIQHIALKSINILDTVAEMRRRGLDFLPISNSYYTKLKKYGRNGIIPHLTSLEWQEIEKQKILVDFEQQNPESLLMQIFTKPIFNQPTFFFELIERRKQAQGFGEGNFRALFELIEKE